MPIGTYSGPRVQSEPSSTGKQTMFYKSTALTDPRFPYIDTLKITEKFGPGSQFYGFGSSEELDDLEQRLEGGEKFVALFTEFPGNPLLRSPDLERIRKLADKYDFCVVVDETIGNFINVNVLQYADVVVSSLTKVFSGDSNVMGGG
jgi:cystathionine gamma-synthase